MNYNLSQSFQQPTFLNKNPQFSISKEKFLRKRYPFELCRKRVLSEKSTKRQLIQNLILHSKINNVHQWCENCLSRLVDSISTGYLKKLTFQIAKEMNFCILSLKNSHEDLSMKLPKRKRKLDRDCIHKKIKCRLFKYLKNKIRSLLLVKYSNLKIPQSIITNATFNFNHSLLTMMVKDIFLEKDFYFANDSQIQQVARSDKGKELKEFLEKKLFECYEDYLNSEFFQKDLNRFEDDIYLETLKKYCSDFVGYYNLEMNDT
jgi:hypothetical protein